MGIHCAGLMVMIMLNQFVSMAVLVLVLVFGIIALGARFLRWGDG